MSGRLDWLRIRLRRGVSLYRAAGFRGVLSVLRQKVGRIRGQQPQTVSQDQRSKLWGDVPAHLRRSLSPERPEVSVVIPVYNGIEFVPACIESLYDAPVGFRFELIVIDQGSTDGTLEYLKGKASSEPDLTLVENEQNVGFGQAINQGCRLARGNYLAISNSDVLFTAGWIDRLVRCMEANPSLAVVSPMTNYVGEGPQIDQDAEGVSEHSFRQYASRCARRAGCIQVVDRLVFFCVLVRRSVFELLGGLSPQYGLGNYEDDDFCVRARLAGFELAIARSAFIFHYGSRTFETQGLSHVDWMQKNESLFYNRVAELSTELPPLGRRSPTSDPNVTVIVRTKDRPRLLRNALASLANQTFDDFEVVVVNDGGSNVEDLLGRFRDYLEIQYHHSEIAVGRSAALNIGCRHARGGLIGYLDDDDIFYPTHLEHLVGVIRRKGSIAAYSSVNKALFRLDPGGQSLTLMERQRFPMMPFDRDWLKVNNWIPLNSVLHRAEAWKEVGGYREELQIFEDWDFLIRLSQLGDFHHNPPTTCEYRFRWGESYDDSTLGMREGALDSMQSIYERYPVERKDLKLARQDALDRIREQIIQVRNLLEANSDPRKAAFGITTLLGGFNSDIPMGS